MRRAARRGRVARRRAALVAAGVLLWVAPAALGDEPRGPVPSFDAVRDHLRVQIRRLGDPLAPGAIWRQDLLDTRTVLVRREGETGRVVDVTAVEAAAWRRTPEELFRLGLENLERREPPRLRQTPKLERGVQVSLLYGEHGFAAAYALSVEHYPTCMGNRGALVAIPSRHATLCYPIESSRAFHGYLALVSMAAQVQEDGDQPIVPHVYWFHDGIFEAQPVRIEGTRVEPERTDAFRELLKELPRDVHDVRPRRW